ncbi:hypothetical protein IC582_002121 [Cucumis melo]|uniref:Malonyl-CoA:anthocyanidin 5-O-glucoside-6''-O-malonyltransferase n=1 Tax=Cucumis melo TaxID=3656 RepID=A0A1S3C6W0_CUCME|nr:malonyl-CoA:anthocyanidin 5-O-glucoside-6''-O-malonyltransferase [Cucumis melo]
MEDDRECLKIVEICRVAPFPSLCSPKFLPLTIFDIILLQCPSISRLYFYQNSITNNNNVLQKLKHSLSLILTHYLPLAGNLIWPQDSHKPIIQFLEGDTVSLTVAESSSDHDFHYLSGDGFRLQAKYCHLVPELPMVDNRVAVMALQLTFFPNKGFSIGITTHHGVVDGKTSTSFFKAWAHVCNNNLDITQPSSIPFYDRTTILNSTSHLEPTSLNKDLNLRFSFQTKPDWFRYTLELRSQDLQKLKKCFDECSSYKATVAYLLVCSAKMKSGLRDGKIYCTFPVDLRSRVHPPLPSNYFGNCIIGRLFSVERKEVLGENGMLVVAREISKEVQSLEEEGIGKAVEKRISQSKMSNEKEERYCMPGSPKFEVYSADFGWGKPIKVELISMDWMLRPLADSKNGDGGIEIGLVGERNELEMMVAVFSQGLQAL